MDLQEKKMTKSTKKLILMIVALLVVAAATVAVVLIVRNKQQPADDTPGSITTYEVLNTDVSEVEFIEIINSAGDTYIIRNNGGYDGVIDGIDEEVPLSAITYSGFVSRFTSIKSYHEPIPVTAESDMGEYGLKDPYGTVVLHKKDGSEIRLLIGEQTVKKNGYYLWEEGSGNLYIVENMYHTSMDYDGQSFIDRQLEIVDQSRIFTVRQLSIVNNVDPNRSFTIQLKDDSVEDLSIYQYEVVSPEYFDADDNKIYENIFTYLNPLTAEGIYTLDVSEENLRALGLYEPQYILEYINNSLKTTIYFARTEDGTPVAMYPGGKVVYKLGDSSVHFLDIGLSDVVSAFIVLQDIDDLKALSAVIGNGEEMTFELPDTEGDHEVRVNGSEKTIDIEDFRNLYSLAISIKIMNDAREDEQSGERIMEIKYVCADDSEHVVDFYEVDGRYAYVTLNGNGRFTVKLSDVEAFQAKLEELIR